MRPTHIRIHLSRLRHNFSVARHLHDNRLLAVVKANAYGHGALACAQALTSLADGFAVATLEEGIELRQAGITQPVILLEGWFTHDDLTLLLDQQLTPVIHAPWQSLQWLREPRCASAPLWIKLDSGMHRLGFPPDEVAALVQRHQRPNLPLVVMTHFAHADGAAPQALDSALTCFHQTVSSLPVETSLSNSGAILGYPRARGTWGRPGLMLYGLDPASPNATPPRAGLLPVMSLHSRLFAIRTIAAGESVGYGGCFSAQRPSRIGVIPCGYADGYPRGAPQGTPVWVGQRYVPLIGRVSMDMLTVDLTDAPETQVGDAVELWGDHLNVGDLAQSVGTIAYELVSQVRRAPRHYVEDGEDSPLLAP